jgi:hypothetical protein
LSAGVVSSPARRQSRTISSWPGRQAALKTLILGFLCLKSLTITLDCPFEAVIIIGEQNIQLGDVTSAPLCISFLTRKMSLIQLAGTIALHIAFLSSWNHSSAPCECSFLTYFSSSFFPQLLHTSCRCIYSFEH